MQISYERSSYLAVGLGVGFGIGIIVWQVYKEKSKQNKELSDCIEKLAVEVRQLKETLILLQKASETVFVKEKARKQKQIDNSDDDDDEFFDFSTSPINDEVNITDESNKHLHGESAEDLTDKLQKADHLRTRSNDDKEDSYNLLLDLSNQFPSDCDVLWRLCRAQYDMAMLCGIRNDKQGKMNFMKNGIETGRTALDINNNIASAHKWYAIVVGNYSEFCGSQEKIELGYQYKQHIEKAIELDPEDPSAYSLLARWCYEVYMLPWYLRKVAAAIFADPPTSTAEEALKYAMKAEDLKPNFWKENTVLIAKCHYQMSNYSKAKEWLLKASDIPTKDEDDRIAQKEIEELLAKV